MRINKDKSTYTPPYSVVLLDALDAYYYADVMDNMEEVTKLDDYGKAIALADALFVTKNYQQESLQAMNQMDDGYDVRIYDKSMSCVYAAHEKYKDNWIGTSVPSFALSPAIQKAIRFSIKTHEIYQKQKRKGKDIPYITHPLVVGLTLARAGASEDVIIAGLLHDTIEDSTDEKKVTREMLSQRFGETVATLVESVTETDKSLTWEERKRDALKHIETFTHDSVLVKSADVITNMSELIDDFGQEGESVWERFNAPKETLLANAYRVIFALHKSWPDSPLAEDLQSINEQLVNLETKYVEGSTQSFFIGSGGERKLIRHIQDEELKKYEKIGSGGSPMGMALMMAFKHSKGFFEKVDGFRVSAEGIGKMINEVLREELPSHPQATPGTGFTYTFYKKKGA